jgi:hypothetical protein
MAQTNTVAQGPAVASGLLRRAGIGAAIVAAGVVIGFMVARGPSESASVDIGSTAPAVSQTWSFQDDFATRHLGSEAARNDGLIQDAWMGDFATRLHLRGG